MGNGRTLEQLTDDDIRTLARCSREQAEVWTLGYLDDAEHVTRIDHEILLSVGVHVAMTGHASMDERAISWLDERRSARRVEIVAWFLHGYWQFSTHASMKACREMMNAANATEDSSMAYRGALFALHSLVTRFWSRHDLSPVRALLLQHLVPLREKGHDGLVQRLETLAHRSA